MQISREDTKRRVTIGINVRNRDVESLVEDIQQQLDSRLNLLPGYCVTYGSDFENLQAAKACLSCRTYRPGTHPHSLIFHFWLHQICGTDLHRSATVGYRRHHCPLDQGYAL